MIHYFSECVIVKNSDGYFTHKIRLKDEGCMEKEHEECFFRRGRYIIDGKNVTNSNMMDRRVLLDISNRILDVAEEYDNPVCFHMALVNILTFDIYENLPISKRKAFLDDFFKAMESSLCKLDEDFENSLKNE